MSLARTLRTASAGRSTEGTSVFYMMHTKNKTHDIAAFVVRSGRK